MKRSWSSREWLPKAATLTLIGVTTTPEGVVVVEADGSASARCPGCRRWSHFRHSRYWRTLKDLAAQGRSVTLRVHLSRWRCGHPRCETAIFADRLTGVFAPRVQHTQRFGAVGHLAGHASSGLAVGQSLIALTKHFSINSRGLRGPEVARDKGGRKRIAVVGGSSAFGTGLASDDARLRCSWENSGMLRCSTAPSSAISQAGNLGSC